MSRPPPRRVIVRTRLESARWPSSFMPVVRAAARAAYEQARKPRWLTGCPVVAIDVLLTHDRRMRRINHQWRGKDKPTNVLSFPQVEMAGPAGVVPPGSALMLGDVILSYETISREAKDDGKTLKAHVFHMMVHGVLHLLGYDHIYEKDARKMERLECDILAGFGYADPYMPMKAVSRP